MEFESGINHLPKTWFLDLDGTLVTHNGYKNGGDTLLNTTINFFNSHVKESDFVIITTARDEKYKEETINFLSNNNIRFNKIIFGLPSGIRILINDCKPDGTKTAFSINLERDLGINF